MDNHALLNIAREAMRQRGLQPDFSVAAQQQAAAATAPIASTGASLRDLRDLLRCSIDNDDSRDLDQLTVALPAADGAQRVLVAIADVDMLVRAGSAMRRRRTAARGKATALWLGA